MRNVFCIITVILSTQGSKICIGFNTEVLWLKNVDFQEYIYTFFPHLIHASFTRFVRVNYGSWEKTFIFRPLVLLPNIAEIQSNLCPPPFQPSASVRAGEAEWRGVTDCHPSLLRADQELSDQRSNISFKITFCVKSSALKIATDNENPYSLREGKMC